MPQQPKLSLDEAMSLIYEVRKTKYRVVFSYHRKMLAALPLSQWLVRLKDLASNMQIHDAISVEAYITSFIKMYKEEGLKTADYRDLQPLLKTLLSDMQCPPNKLQLAKS